MVLKRRLSFGEWQWTERTGCYPMDIMMVNAEMRLWETVDLREEGESARTYCFKCDLSLQAKDRMVQIGLLSNRGLESRNDMDELRIWEICWECEVLR